MLAVLTFLAQGTSNTQEAPDTGVGAGLIIGAFLLALLLFCLIFFLFHRTTSSSQGGVEPVAGSRERGDPPFESIERERETPHGA